MEKTPKKFLTKNILLIIAIIYLLLPIDLIPDSIPVFGNLDDTAFFVIALIKNYVDWKKSEGDKEEDVQEGEIVR